MDSDASDLFGEGFDPQAALQQMGEHAEEGAGSQPYQVGQLVEFADYSMCLWGASRMGLRLGRAAWWPGREMAFQ